MDALRESPKAHDELQRSLIVIRFVTYLIRGAIFRPRYTRLSSIPEGIRPFKELVGMFHTHEASEPRDNVYALLGMSSDKMNESQLSPDYTVPFEELLMRLAKTILSERVSVETRSDREIAVIKAKGERPTPTYGTPPHSGHAIFMPLHFYLSTSTNFYINYDATTMQLSLSLGLSDSPDSFMPYSNSPALI
jgi:hypothetical protein